jgi:hypothetical protein
MSEQFDTIVIGMGPGGEVARHACWPPVSGSLPSRRN